VRVVVKRCFGTRFGVVKTLTARGVADRTFKGSFAVSVPSKCFVLARYAGAVSKRAYFRAR
jgi:hypothetical protein